MWTRYFMRTAFILILAITTLTPELDANIGTWIQLDDGLTMDDVRVLEAGERRLYAATDNGIFISQDHGHTWHATSFKDPSSTITVDGSTV